MKSLFSLFVGLLAWMGVACADDVAPDALVKTVTEEVLTIIRADKDIQNGNTQKVLDLVDKKVLPHFNFTRMTALALGRDWAKATPEQKQRLTEEFRTLLVRTYSNALTAYRSQTVHYKPFRAQAGEADVVVKTEIRQPGAAAIQLDYSLERGEGGWKVYDVVVAGVSLVTNYRGSFSQEVRANGIDGLVKTLAAKNRQLETDKGQARK